MTFETIRDVLAWSAVINIGLLLFWWMIFVLAHDFVYRIHGKWFKFPVESFDKIHYSAMAFWKICIFIFIIGPYLAMRIVG